MTTDAARPRQRSSGDGWSLEAHDTGGLSVHTLRGESGFAVSPKLADLLGLGGLMPVHPAREAVEASWGAA